MSAAAFAAASLIAAPASASILGKSPEISIGRETASLVEKYYKVDTDPVAVARVRQIGRRLAACAENSDYPFEFHVVDDKDVNAFALPGGFVYIYRGLLQILPDDDALASVMAHEISHVTRRHGIRQLEKEAILSTALNVVLSATGAGFSADQASQAVQAIVGITFTRHDEKDADENGIYLMARAGYNPLASVTAMETLRHAVGDPEKREPGFFRTHPSTSDRIRTLGRLAEEIKVEQKQVRAQSAPLPPPPSAAPRRLAGLETLEVAPCVWFPLVPGSRWSYRVHGEGAEGRTTVRVLESVAAEPAGVARVEYDLGQGVRSCRLVAPAGDRFVSRPESAETASWATDALFGEKEPLTDRRLRYAGTEKVAVIAGEFEAARVETLSVDGQPESVAWYARGIGLVKRSSLKTGTTEELTGYLIPKNAP